MSTQLGYKGYVGASRWQWETTSDSNIFIIGYWHRGRVSNRKLVTIPEHSTLDSGYYFTDDGKAIPKFVFRHLWSEAQPK
jgi:uncharacterized protein (UPF0248 family)